MLQSLRDESNSMTLGQMEMSGKKNWLKALVFVTVTPILAAGGFFAYLYVSQESMIFQGTKLPHDHQFIFDVPFEEVVIPVDGAQINALHFQQPDPRGLIFFLHGNGGNLDSWTTNVDYYRRVNYDMFMLDYRGYGKSTGHIQSEAQLHDDVRVAWDLVASRYETKPIVVYGRSLGAALAAKLAADVDPDLLILVSPFSSVVAIARQQYPYLPEWIARYPLRTDRLIPDIRAPIVFVHGDADRLIPLDHSYTLKDLANKQSKLLVIEGAGHNDIHLFERYVTGLTAELPSAFRNE